MIIHLAFAVFYRYSFPWEGNDKTRGDPDSKFFEQRLFPSAHSPAKYLSLNSFAKPPPRFLCATQATPIAPDRLFWNFRSVCCLAHPPYRLSVPRPSSAGFIRSAMKEMKKLRLVRIDGRHWAYRRMAPRKMQSMHYLPVHCSDSDSSVLHHSVPGMRSAASYHTECMRICDVISDSAAVGDAGPLQGPVATPSYHESCESW